MGECIPKYEPGQDLTGYVTQGGGGVVGGRFLALSGDKRGVEAVSDDVSGGNVQVAYPAAGGRVFGVSGYDAAQTKLVKVIRGRGKVVPVLAGADLAYDVELMTTVTGTVIAWTPPVTTAVGAALATPNAKVGRTIRSAVNGGTALVELY